MNYQLIVKEAFWHDLLSAPRRTQNLVTKRVCKELSENPDSPRGNTLKKLSGYKELWRYRLGDFRLVYEVKKAASTVNLLMLGHRGKIYDRLHYTPGEGVRDNIPSIVIDLLESELPVRNDDLDQQSSDHFAADKSPLDPELLPQTLSGRTLLQWGVPAEYRGRLIKCTAVDDLFECDVPAGVLERVLNGLFPKSIEEVIQDNEYIIHKPDELEALIKGQLTTLLLKLDEEQQQYVYRTGTGPWILKGGPGSGKSLVAIHRAHNLVTDTMLPPSVLFATYTNSLVAVTRELLEELNAGQPSPVKVATVNSIATDITDLNSIDRRIATESDIDHNLRKAIEGTNRIDIQATFNPDDIDFLLEEFEWVILGRGIATEEEYLGTSRSGRGRALTEKQRQGLWAIYEQFKTSMRQAKLVTHDQIVWIAVERLKKQKRILADSEPNCSSIPIYNHVFIDEAQDLKPLGIQLCLELSDNGVGVFLTADENQSIYGRGVGWSRVHDSLRFRGKSMILNKNYRSTIQIASAAAEIVHDLENYDSDTIVQTAYREGVMPYLKCCKNEDEEIFYLGSWIKQQARELRVPYGNIAVLCRRNKAAAAVASRLTQFGIPTQFMSGKQVTLRSPDVKVMTIHAAKGLQFPIVAIPHANDGSIPIPPRRGVDETEHLVTEKKLFFVACTRAMQRLLVTTSINNSSPFLKVLTSSNWNIEDRVNE
ncbi:3'-5' exonuclease [Gemmatimonadota bacterium]